MYFALRWLICKLFEGYKPTFLNIRMNMWTNKAHSNVEKQLILYSTLPGIHPIPFRSRRHPTLGSLGRIHFRDPFKSRSFQSISLEKFNSCVEFGRKCIASVSLGESESAICDCEKLGRPGESADFQTNDIILHLNRNPQGAT